MNIKQLLSHLGITAHESQIYLALIKLGPSIISRIGEHTGMHSPTIYKAIRALIEKGLITISPRGKQNRYIAESPEKLKEVFNAFYRSFERILPDIQRTYDIKKQKPLVKFIEGKRGVKYIYEDLLSTLKRGDIFYCYTSRRASRAIRRYAPRNYYTRRDEKGIQRFVITDALTESQEKPDMNRSIKILPAKHGIFDDNIRMLIYGNKVAIGDLDTETAIVVESPLFASLQRKIFKTLYELL